MARLLQCCLDSRTGTASTSRHNVYCGAGRLRGNDASFLSFLLILICSCAVAPLRQIDPQRASQIINQPQVLLLDVRTEEEYRDGHIERAVFLPITELEKRLNELPPDKNAAIEL